MSYDVVWKPQARLDVKQIKRSSLHRQAVDSAVFICSGALSDSPESVGESRAGSVRVERFPPLWVYFRIVEEDRRVDVLYVRSIDRP